MDRLDAMRLFVRVVESGSFSAAAREAGVGQPAVSKQIAALEAHLGAQLLRRTSRRVTLTDAGQTFYEAAVRLTSELDAATSLIGRGRSAPSGLVRLAVAPALGRLFLVPKLPEFFARYPGITLELSVAERTLNLIEEGVDLAVYHGELAGGSLVVRTIATTPFVTVATPAYLEARGVPATPRDLDRHTGVIFAPHREPRPWEFRDASGPIVYHPHGSVRTADAEQLRAAALAGLGLAHSPGWLFAADVRSGAVRVVLPGYQPRALPISAVHPAGRRPPTKVQVLLDFLADVFARDSSLAIG